MDRVVGALLSAIATLETLLELDSHAHMALSTLEEIAYRLGEMSDEERHDFDAALSRVADAYDRDESGSGNWVRDVPSKFGLA